MDLEAAGSAADACAWAAGAVAGRLATQPRRHDHGSQDMSEHFQAQIAFPGIQDSPVFNSPVFVRPQTRPLSCR